MTLIPDRFYKQPKEREHLQIDFSARLEEDETISGIEMCECYDSEGNDVTDEIIENPIYDDTSIWFWFKNVESGSSYNLTVRVITTKGAIFEEDLLLIVQEVVYGKRKEEEKTMSLAISDIRLIRWGRTIEPEWEHGVEVTAPSAGAALVTKTVSPGMTGYIYGFFIAADEANDFRINWTSSGNSKSIRIPFGGKGALHYINHSALNEGAGADAGTDITITNIRAGNSGIVYQARIFFVEV